MKMKWQPSVVLITFDNNHCLIIFDNNRCFLSCRGEILEIMDDSRKWWKARNWRGHVAHVPHTIVQELGGTMNGRDGHGRDGHNGSSSPNDDWIRRERQGKKGEFRYF